MSAVSTPHSASDLSGPLRGAEMGSLRRSLCTSPSATGLETAAARGMATVSTPTQAGMPGRASQLEGRLRDMERICLDLRDVNRIQQDSLQQCLGGTSVRFPVACRGSKNSHGCIHPQACREKQVVVQELREALARNSTLEREVLACKERLQSSVEQDRRRQSASSASLLEDSQLHRRLLDSQGRSEQLQLQCQKLQEQVQQYETELNTRSARIVALQHDLIQAQQELTRVTQHSETLVAENEALQA
eukprot:RCo033090